MDIKTIVEGPWVANPDLSQVDEIGWTELAPGADARVISGGLDSSVWATSRAPVAPEGERRMRSVWLAAAVWRGDVFVSASTAVSSFSLRMASRSCTITARSRQVVHLGPAYWPKNFVREWGFDPQDRTSGGRRGLSQGRATGGRRASAPAGRFDVIAPRISIGLGIMTGTQITRARVMAGARVCSSAATTGPNGWSRMGPHRRRQRGPVFSGRPAVQHESGHLCDADAGSGK